MSRRKIRRIIDVGGAYLNNKRVRVASRQVKTGDQVRLEYVEEQVTKVQKTDFVITDSDILYEDDRLLVINKPPGLPSQATRDQSILHVIHVIERYYQAKGQACPKLVLVHRLDKETSGALIVAKDEQTATYISDQFRQKTVEKEYHAICYGKLTDSTFAVECHLSAIQSKTGQVRQVFSGGKYSYTDFRVEAVNQGMNLNYMLCFPKTGRSHQLRVHLELSGTPIVGDKKYGHRQSNRLPEDLAKLTSEHQLLHCRKMCFKGVDGAAIVVEAPLPPNFAGMVERVFGSTDQ